MQTITRAAALVVALLAGGCASLSVSSTATTGQSSSAVAALETIRSENGLPTLAADGRLEAAARQQAAYMADAGKMAHTTGWGRDFASRMKANGVEGAAAENVAHGRMDQGRLIDMWMRSQAHRRNMLDPRFSKFGLASAEDGTGQRYWAIILGR